MLARDPWSRGQILGENIRCVAPWVIDKLFMDCSQVLTALPFGARLIVALIDFILLARCLNLL
jgi:hypothetical protein